MEPVTFHTSCGTEKEGFEPSRPTFRPTKRDACLPDHVGYYLAGLADGEGCFSISRGSRGIGYVCAFIIKLRLDDKPLLEWLQAETGLGSIYTGLHATSPNGKPWARWNVQKKLDVRRLTEIFDDFPLRSKKQRDYAIWREAAIYWSISAMPVDWDPLEQWFHELRAVREYRAPVRLGRSG